MKILYSIVMLLFMCAANAQHVSDYKYIVVPDSFSGFETNQYQLNDYLKIMLGDKNYQVLSQSSSNWPSEARLNPCFVLRSDAKKVVADGLSKVELSFTDCNQRTVFTSEGTSNAKSFEEGYKTALQIATDLVAKQQAEMPTYREDETKRVTIITTESSDAQEILPVGKRSVSKTQKLDKFQKYSYNGQTIYITSLDNDQLILTTSDRSKILAQFYPSALEGVYHVKVFTGNQNYYYTIGYYDNITLWYEYTDDNETWTKIEFQKLEE